MIAAVESARNDGVMPTTLTGLVLFVVLLLPGFAYVTGKERHTTGQQLSPFRESAAVVAASVSFELIVLVLFAVVRTLLPSHTPDVGALVRDGSGYLRGHGGHAGHYGEVAIWAAGMLTVSAALAYGATLPAVRKLASKPLGPYPHQSAMSGWWLLFDSWPTGEDIHVGCILDDGSYIEGRLASFSREADDKPDRDLILADPIGYRSPGADNLTPYPASLACFSAARIVTMFVTYVGENPPVISSTAAEAEAEQASAAEVRSSASALS